MSDTSNAVPPPTGLGDPAVASGVHGVLHEAQVTSYHRRGSTCSAQTRAGHACKRRPLANGRCTNHGGLSTGPKTADGRARIAEAQRLRWAQWRNVHGPKTPLLITVREVHDGLGGVHRRGDRPVLPAATAEILIARNTAVIDRGASA
jgi:hypothetical protein